LESHFERRQIPLLPWNTPCDNVSIDEDLRIGDEEKEPDQFLFEGSRLL